jgi:hypothetical protein
VPPIDHRENRNRKKKKRQQSEEEIGESYLLQLELSILSLELFVDKTFVKDRY